MKYAKWRLVLFNHMHPGRRRAFLLTSGTFRRMWNLKRQNKRKTLSPRLNRLVWEQDEEGNSALIGRRKQGSAENGAGRGDVKAYTCTICEKR